MRILVTGATGYIGRQLAPLLVKAGHDVTCMVRDTTRAIPAFFNRLTVVEADPLRRDTLPAALKGIDVVYYLIHSMSGAEHGFEERDRLAAYNFATAAAAAGVKRVIYLGGLVTTGTAASAHLKSRVETGAVLRKFGPPLTEFRAGIIVGNGSTSFEIIRCLTERLPVMICPRWVITRTQPIAVHDVLRYLVSALQRPKSIGQIIEIGGATVETYRNMMLTYARLRELRRWLVRVPVLTPRLSSYWLDLVTPVPAAVTRPLIEGMRSEAVCTEATALALFPNIWPMSYEAAVKMALQHSGPETAPDHELPQSEGHWAIRDQGLTRDVRQSMIQASSEQVFQLLEGIGGRNGWFHANVLWRLRGWIDKLAGGVGMSRGRTNAARLREGEPVDFWRVQRVLPNRSILLRAEMKLPGRAWLQFELLPQPQGKTLLRCCAWFQPRGLLGEIYWYALYPIHLLIFSGMVRAIKRTAEKRAPSLAAA